MATITIDASNPSASINIATLKSCIGNILEADRRGAAYMLAPDEYLLLNEILFAVTTGVPSANTVTAVVMTY